jgi:3-hydroxyacyl-CoA dehydrogenase
MKRMIAAGRLGRKSGKGFLRLRVTSDLTDRLDAERRTR